MPKIHPDKGKLELELASKGMQVVGIDEVGRGCLAGPVCAAAVILDYDKLQQTDPAFTKLIRDSKTLSSLQRKKIIPVLEDICQYYEVAVADVEEIDEVNILNATFIAMKRAVNQLPPIAPTNSQRILLIDGNQTIPNFDTQQKAIVKGDSFAFCIAAASIIAKEYRDQLMADVAKQYPNYCLERHVGYGTKAHIEALEKYGPTAIHRKSFAPVRRLL